MFVGLEATMDTRLGAVVMGTGVPLGVGTMLYRLQTGSERPGTPERVEGNAVD